MTDIIQVADNANMIINGYAFTKENGNIRVLNLNNLEKSVFMDSRERVLETSMDIIFTLHRIA